MPVGMNQKSLAARERKATLAQAEKQRRAEIAEAQKWVDNDKYIARKNDRKQQLLEKAEERIQRKQELRQLAEDEEKQFTSGKKGGKDGETIKLTRAEILRRQLQAAAQPSKASSEDESAIDILPNMNRIIRKETLEALGQGNVIVSASSLDGALAALSVEDERAADRRMKTAFRAFEEVTMPRLKIENPTLKRSQLIELLYKQWKKSPDNPLNFPETNGK